MEHTILSPGDTVLIYRKISQDTSAPVLTKVLTVHRGAITVPEWQSLNGIATIRTHGTSAVSGTYWYEYKRIPDGQGTSEDVTSIHLVSTKAKGFIEGYTKIVTDQFIPRSIDEELSEGKNLIKEEQ
jgi:hypothetical protein